ncbi:hypothetical protein B0I37DRAFT_384676 [Chaetomium sp. MPI-CAGE-AT-0009]|nr:hypothetical protein B0I37DRAFT_384676 [Chaetomium sp. MPI-CAGE-AT-0009]
MAGRRTNQESPCERLSRWRGSFQEHPAIPRHGLGLGPGRRHRPLTAGVAPFYDEPRSSTGTNLHYMICEPVHEDLLAWLAPSQARLLASIACRWIKSPISDLREGTNCINARLRRPGIGPSVSPPFQTVSARAVWMGKRVQARHCPRRSRLGLVRTNCLIVDKWASLVKWPSDHRALPCLGKDFFCVKPLVQERRRSVVTQRHGYCRSNSSCERANGSLQPSGAAASPGGALPCSRQQRSNKDVFNVNIRVQKKHGTSGSMAAGGSAIESIVAPTDQSLSFPAAGMHVGRPHAGGKFPGLTRDASKGTHRRRRIWQPRFSRRKPSRAVGPRRWRSRLFGKPRRCCPDGDRETTKPERGGEQ